jgi:hypothetical protein
MADTDRVLPRQDSGARTPASEKRLILSAPRKGGPAGGKSRVVEVVYLRRGPAKPVQEPPQLAPWSLRAATWPEGFRAKSTAPLPREGIEVDSAETAQPITHVMPMWEPSAPEAPPATETATVEPRQPRGPKPHAAKTTARHFADPFAEDDSGANCIRCGYLVEQAREKRGLLTCTKCG